MGIQQQFIANPSKIDECSLSYALLCPVQRETPQSDYPRQFGFSTNYGILSIMALLFKPVLRKSNMYDLTMIFGHHEHIVFVVVVVFCVVLASRHSYTKNRYK